MFKIRLLIVADDPFARAGLAALLASQPECEVTGQGDSTLALDDDIANEADVIVWDLGWETAVPLPDWHDSFMPVLALLAEDSQANAVWATGVQSLLHREIEIEKIVTAAQATWQGLTVLDPTFTATVIPSISSTNEPLLDALTAREEDVLQLLAQGLTNKAIGHHLLISDHTVKFHVNALMRKLNAQSRTEAVVRASQLGLILL